MHGIIEVKEIRLVIKNKAILSNISLHLEQGKIYGIVGRNGSGKTMLMKCICGFLPVTEGSICIQGKVIGKDIDFSDNLRFIIETPGFIPYYSGYKNLKLLADINGKIGKKEIEQALETVGLAEAGRLAVRKYSLGMRQRLGLAQAIMENPDILLLDEPMNGLDNEGVISMRKYLLTLKEQGKTILLASHSSEDINQLCDETFELEHGRLLRKFSKAVTEG